MNEEKLPLFLLNAVLFPHMHLPLQVFEPRYLEMIQECLERERSFGVQLIQQGQEVGGTAIPEPIGCSAEIISSEEQEDGRLLIVTRGVRRYRILELDQTRAFQQARVEYRPELTSEADHSLAQQVFGYFSEVLEQMGLKMNFDEEILDDATQLSFIIAAYLTRENQDKQKLLALDSVAERLRLELQWMEELLASLKMTRKVEQVARRNGKMKH